MAKASVFTVTLVAALASREAAAKVGEPTLEDLVAQSDVIVLARTEAMEPYVSETGWERRAATAQVLETWFGAPGPQVRFRASKPFPCDTSWSEVGDTALLFLGPPRANGVRSIAGFGRGRYEGYGDDRVSSFRVRDRSWEGRTMSYGVLKERIQDLLATRAPDKTLAPAEDERGFIPPYEAPSRVEAALFPAVGNEDRAIGFASACVLASLWVAIGRWRAARAMKPSPSPSTAS